MSASGAASRFGDRAQPQHILIVDDNFHISDLLQQHLCSEGFVVTCASGGKDARDILKDGSVDLALIDLVMPGESGLSIADFAASLGVSVILMTGSPDKLDGVTHRKIAKPFNLETLTDAIMEACGGNERKAE